MPEKLPTVKKAWTMLSYILNDNCRIYSERFFRGGHNSLLPFVQYLALNPLPTPQEKKRIVTGIYLTIMSGIFAGAEARMGNFSRNDVKPARSFPLKKIAALARNHYGILGLDSLFVRHLDLALNIAHNGITIDGNPDELQRDHIFPRSMLEKEGYDYRKINHYSNFHFLRGKDNGNKSDIAPHLWFRNPGKDIQPYSDRDLEDRLLTWDLLEPGSFSRMIEYRTAKIKDRAEDLFGLSSEEFDALFI
jgi:hypothetical protein